LPHEPPAILLDAVEDWSESHLRAAVLIRETSPFARDAGVPAHVAIEYMAQACAAFVGIEARCKGTSPRIGLLLGTRHFLSQRQWFTVGEQLTARVDLVYRDEEVGVFDCAVRAGQYVLATARLTVAQPADIAAVLAERSEGSRD
jgi:predicted hotdog family 3-hydroxylacyl-ACP dehydratase